MKRHLRLVHDQDRFECFAVPAAQPAPEPAEEPRPPMPGASRRDWVYREMDLLGAEPVPAAETD